MHEFGNFARGYKAETLIEAILQTFKEGRDILEMHISLLFRLAGFDYKVCAIDFSKAVKMRVDYDRQVKPCLLILTSFGRSNYTNCNWQGYEWQWNWFLWSRQGSFKPNSNVSIHMKYFMNNLFLFKNCIGILTQIVGITYRFFLVWSNNQGAWYPPCQHALR